MRPPYAGKSRGVLGGRTVLSLARIADEMLKFVKKNRQNLVQYVVKVLAFVLRELK